MPRQLPLLVLFSAILPLATIAYAQTPVFGTEDDFALTKEDLESSQVFVNADRVKGDLGEDIEASGNVRMFSRGVRISTDFATYNATENSIRAPGTVVIERAGDRAEGRAFEYDLDTNQGVMRDITYRLSKNAQRKYAGRGDAREAVFLDQNQTKFTLGRYTTCPPGQDDWFLRVRDLRVDRERDIGVARNASVVFKDIPILYTPWVSFPLDDQRKSGFLTPSVGTSDQGGFELTAPYYFNIAPNFDDTLTPRVMSKRGLQLNNEFRYLLPRFNGQLDTEYLPSDRITDEDRYFVWLRHYHRLPKNWSGSLHLQHASDNDYFRDLSNSVALTSQVNLPREATLTYSGAVWNLSGRALRYQTLQDPLQPIAPPYRLLPQINLIGRKYNFHGADLILDSEFTNFDHPTLVKGRRLIAYPSVSYPLLKSFAYLTPKLGLHYTQYDIDNPDGSSAAITRTVPIFSLDSGLFFERDLSYRARPYLQTLEPRLYLVRVPFREQSQIPNFSTSETDFNFAQMFTENRFVGGDRISDADQVTLALTTRFIERASGIERLRAAVGQRYNLTDQRVTLSGPPTSTRVSDLLMAVTGQVSSKWAVDMGWQYDTDVGLTEKYSLGTRYTRAPGKLINFNYRFVRDAPPQQGVRQVDISTEWPLTSRWYVLGRANYSLRDKELVEGLLGLEYNAGCWQFRLLTHRFTTAEQEVANSLFVQLELSGLTKLGTNPLDTLRLNIPGYIQTGEISK